MKTTKALFFSASLLLLTTLFCPTTAVGQTPLPITYSYDAAGNRTVRKVLELKGVTTNSDTSTTATKNISSMDDSPFGNDYPKDATYYTDKMQTIGLRVYPNPTAGKVSIGLDNAIPGITYTVHLFNSHGSLLLTLKGSGTQIELDMASFPDGIYSTEITAGTERTAWRIIKK